MVGTLNILDLNLADDIAYNVFTPESLSRIMQKAADLEIFLSTRPKFGLIESWTIQDGPERLFEEFAIVFDKPGEAIYGYENRLQLIQNLDHLGSIRNCGKGPANAGSYES